MFNPQNIFQVHLFRLFSLSTFFFFFTLNIDHFPKALKEPSIYYSTLSTYYVPGLARYTSSIDTKLLLVAKICGSESNFKNT